MTIDQYIGTSHGRAVVRVTPMLDGLTVQVVFLDLKRGAEIHHTGHITNVEEIDPEFALSAVKEAERILKLH